MNGHPQNITVQVKVEPAGIHLLVRSLQPAGSPGAGPRAAEC